MEAYTLYIGGRHIKKAKEINTNNIKIENDRTGKEEKLYESMSAGGTLEMEAKIERLDMLGLMYGRKITNNWLKMHGGVMGRRNGKKKKGRKNE